MPKIPYLEPMDEAVADSVRVTKKKAAPPVDADRLQAQIIAAKDTRADAIGRRDKARADSSANATVANLMAKEGGAYGKQPAALRESANRQGAEARDDDALIARTAAKIGAKADTLRTRLKGFRK